MATHPVLGRKANWIYYILAWSVILSLHVILVYNYSTFSLKYAFTDAGIQVGMLALIGLGTWYLVRYTDMEMLKRSHVLVNLVFGGITLLLIWFVLSFGVLYLLFKDDPSVIEYLRETSYLRSGMALVLFSIVVLVYYTINYYNHFHEKLRTEEQLKENARELELAYLRAQINPHFLFNALNSVSSLVVINPDKAQETIVELSEYLRQNMFLSRKRFVTVKEELENITRYLEIEEIRYGERVSKTFKIPSECENMALPSLILQPLFENAVKFGLHESTGILKVFLDIRCNDDFLYIRIQNNYDDNAQTAAGTGRGLENVRQRLSIIYQRNDLLNVEDKENEFVVTLKIPQYIEDPLNRLES